MNNELINIYSHFIPDHLPAFFDELIDFINRNSTVFEKFVYKNSLAILKKASSSDYYIGSSDDNFRVAINYYLPKIRNCSDQDLCRMVMNLLWDLATFMTDEPCPNCHDSNLKIASSLDRKQVYKTCDNCLTTLYNNQFIERPFEMVPATKKQISAF